MRRMKIYPRYLDLIYPLDVYAALLQHHTGHVPALGFGSLSQQQLDDLDLTDKSTDACAAQMAELLIEAQQQQYRKLLAFIDLPRLQQGRAQPLQVLEIGCGRGALALQLAAAGCQVTAQDCSAEVMDPQLQVPGITTRVGDFKDFAAESSQQRRFDLIVLQNSARYFLPMQLLSAVKKLLRDNGELVVLEEFIRSADSRHKPQPLPLADHFLALAERLGFETVQREDLGATTLPFQQLLCRLFFQSLPQLCLITSYPAEKLEALYQSLCAETAGTESGMHQHLMLRFSKMDNEYHNNVLLMSAADLPASAFATVFERSFDVGFNAGLWAWKYNDGRGASVAAVRDGQVLAHYGGVVRHILYFGQPSRAVQICDVMVLPGERSFFSRKGLFFKTASTMLEQYVGYHADNLLGFGFPNIKAMHVAERLKLYEKTDEFIQLTLADNYVDAGSWAQQVVSLESVSSAANQLWAQMQTGFADAIIGTRDADYLHYRYAQRPGQHYECIQVSAGSVTKGLGIRRPHGDGWLLMDILAAPEDLGDVLKVLLQPASQAGPVCFWVTAGQLHRLQSFDGLNTSNTGIQIPCNRWTDGPATETLSQRWWLTAGDMDFL
jgi:SAM-dependent methyltransferase